MPSGAGAHPTSGSLLRKGTLGWRILSWFLALSLLPLILTNSVGYSVSLRILEDQVDTFLRSLTQSQAIHVAHQVRLNELEMDGYATSHREFPALVRAAVGEIESGISDGTAVAAIINTLRHELRESAVFDEFLVAAPDGTWILSTSDALSQPGWFAAWVDGRAWVEASTTEAWDVGDRVLPVLTVAHPVVDDRGLAGVFIGASHLPSQRRFLGIPEHLAGYVESFVVSATGNPLFLSHPHGKVDYGSRLESPLLAEPSGTIGIYDNREGASVVANSVVIPRIGWRYVAEVSRDAVFGEMRRLRTLSMVFGTLFALVLVGIVWLVARSLVSPVRELVAAAERLRARELGVQVRADRTDEIGQLGRTFNLMSSELARSVEELHELHELQLSRAAQFATVGELASGIAHGIKNPVAGMTGGLEILAQSSAGDAWASETLAQMRIHLGQIETSINDLLSYARPKNPDTVRVDPGQLVDETLTLLDAGAEASGIEINRIVASDVPDVTVDPTQITNAILNLSLNGIQAMPDGGVLTIEVSHDADNVRIAVADTGQGIPEGRLDDVLRPFYTTKHRGSGLGLAITRGIVERNGGRLEVVSTTGVGSKFTLVLPVRSRKAQ